MTSQGGRKHSVCLFRKLWRNMCSDSRSALVPTGGQWRTLEGPSQAGASGSNCEINRAFSVETFSRPPQSDSHLLEELSAMDTDMDPTGSGYAISDVPRLSNLTLINQQCHLSSSDTIMELDSGVDPETGERAQG